MEEIKFYKGLDNNLPELSQRESSSFYITTDSGKMILGSNIWQANLSVENAEFTSAKTSEKYILYMNGNEIFSIPVISWDVEYKLVGCNSSNTSKLVEHNTTYTTTISPISEDFSFKSCKVYVSGVDRTKECFDESTMTITINNVKCNVIINVEFEELVDTVGYIQDREIYLYEDKLGSGTYTLRYEDKDNNILDSFGIITDEATI